MDNNENQVNIPGAGENPQASDVTEVFGQQAAGTEEGAAAVEEAPKKAEVVEEAPKPKKASPFADSPYMFQAPPEKPKAAPKSQKKSAGGWKKFLCAVLALAVLAGACALTAQVVGDRYEDRMEQLESRFEDRMEQLEKALEKAQQENIVSGGNQVVSSGNGLSPAQVYAMNSQSVVLILNTYTNSYGQNGTSTGSGFILTQDGYEVTNHHVIEGNGTLAVVTNDGKRHSAKLIGSDNANDVALLKMEGSQFPAVKLGDSNALKVGDQVAAIGNPLGELTSTLTVGYISAMGRDVNTSGFAINMIQTDAAINSGNSGGPLFNMKGEVIGITTAKYSGSSASGATIEGIGFAIPINDVRDLLEDLSTNGHSTAPYLGVSVSDVDAEAAAYFGMPVGARVNEVVAGSCSEKAGLKAKDIIVKLGDYEVRNVNELTRALRKYKAGDAVEMVIYRGGAKMVLKVILDQRPADAAQQPQVPEQPQEGTQQTTPEGFPPEGMPSEGDWEEWFKYLFPFFSGRN